MPRKHTILVVDDEADVVKSVQDLLRLDYKVLGATSAPQALDLLKNNPVHVVMSDQRMPETTGVDFLAAVRRDHPDVVRLLFTGYADIRAVIDAINQGSVWRYITKPWDPDELQAVIREACERHDLAAERRSLIEQLEAKNRQLVVANDDLRAANDLKSAFIQVVSHELRTPLSIVVGFSDLAQRAGGLEEPLKGSLDRIQRASHRLLALVNQIVSMLQAGKFETPLERKWVDVARLLAESTDEIGPFAQRRGQSLICDWPADIGQAFLEPAKIRDCIDHLLLNAIKFTPDGGRITVFAKREPAGGITLGVADTGVGIEPAALQRIGEAFFTGFDVTRHTSGSFEFNARGVGLGLSVVKLFVKMHGGALDVDSQPGRGATFTIRLPAEDPQDAASPAPSNSQQRMEFPQPAEAP